MPLESKVKRFCGFCYIIPMDIITQGDFSVTNKNGVTVFSFRVPSLTVVDFVKEVKKRRGHRGKGKREFLR